MFFSPVSLAAPRTDKMIATTKKRKAPSLKGRNLLLNQHYY